MNRALISSLALAMSLALFQGCAAKQDTESSARQERSSEAAARSAQAQDQLPFIGEWTYQQGSLAESAEVESLEIQLLEEILRTAQVTLAFNADHSARVTTVVEGGEPDVVPSTWALRQHDRDEYLLEISYEDVLDTNFLKIYVNEDGSVDIDGDGTRMRFVRVEP